MNEEEREAYAIISLIIVVSRQWIDKCRHEGMILCRALGTDWKSMRGDEEEREAYARISLNIVASQQWIDKCRHEGMILCQAPGTDRKPIEVIQIYG